MTSVYFITNNNVLKSELKYTREMSEEEKKEQLPLSIKGEIVSKELSKLEEFKNITALYCSNFSSSINTAKYLSEELKLDIQIEERLKERKVGILGINNERFLKETQEHDFEYKFHNGENLNMVKNRMREFLKEVLWQREDESIAIFTHDMAIESLFSLWCDKGFNLENQMILNFKESVIIDGAHHPCRIFKVEFETDKLKSISWFNEKELF